MAVANQETGTITQGPRALEHFTDRDEAVQRFLQYVNQDPPQQTILFFYGVGGIGKSLLLQFLRKHCCRPLTDWETPQHVGYASLRKAYDTHAITFPNTILDFGMQPNAEDHPQQAMGALLMLRHALSGDQLRFPLFDFAVIWYLHQTKSLSSARIASLFPDELTALGGIVDAISKHSYGTLATAVINVFSKHFKERAIAYWHKRHLAPAAVERIQALETPREVLEELPACFAADLKAGMTGTNAPKRVILFFDTHEAFWGDERGLGDAQHHRRDEWFRYLLTTLQPQDRIVIVIAAQQPPRWSKAPKYAISDDDVDYRLIGNLTEDHANEYLRNADIKDTAMRQAACSLAQVEPGQIHPLFLGLCTDIILEATRRGITLTPEDFAKSPRITNVGRTLTDRLLKCVDQETADAAHVLSACRAFDRNIYLTLARELHFHATEQAFQQLTSFSFVSPAEGRPLGPFRIHELLRRLLHENNDDREQTANTVLEGYYRHIGGPAGTAEAIYHATRQDPIRGVREWVTIFDAALWSSDYACCQALLAVRGAMGVKGPLETGMLTRCEADFLSARARYVESDREYQRSLKHFEHAKRENDTLELTKHLALLHLNYGTLQSERSQFEKAATSFTTVINLCNGAHRDAKDDIELGDLEGEAYLGLGDVYIWQAKSQPAIENYATAVTICSATPGQEPKAGASQHCAHNQPSTAPSCKQQRKSERKSSSSTWDPISVRSTALSSAAVTMSSSPSRRTSSRSAVPKTSAASSPNGAKNGTNAMQHGPTAAFKFLKDAPASSDTSCSSTTSVTTPAA
jgi:tetratricopeptide (TPR) repeat protein